MKVKVVVAYPQMLKVSPMGNRLYKVAEDVGVDVHTDEGCFRLKFYKGFVTNFRSGGVAVDCFVDQVGDEKKALCYLVHDAMYTPCDALKLEHPVSRKKADEILRAGLRYSGMGAFKAGLVYNSVRLFGGSAYEEDDALTSTNSKLFRFEWTDR